MDDGILRHLPQRLAGMCARAQEIDVGELGLEKQFAQTECFGLDAMKVALIAPSNAGKTSLIEMLVTISLASDKEYADVNKEVTDVNKLAATLWLQRQPKPIDGPHAFTLLEMSDKYHAANQENGNREEQVRRKVRKARHYGLHGNFSSLGLFFPGSNKGYINSRILVSLAWSHTFCILVRLRPLMELQALALDHLKVLAYVLEEVSNAHEQYLLSIWQFLTNGANDQEELHKYQAEGATYTPPLAEWVRSAAGTNYIMRSRGASLLKAMLFTHDAMHVILPAADNSHNFSNEQLAVVESFAAQERVPGPWTHLLGAARCGDPIVLKQMREGFTASILSVDLFVPSKLLYNLNIQLADTLGIDDGDVRRLVMQRTLEERLQNVVVLLARDASVEKTTMAHLVASPFLLNWLWGQLDPTAPSAPRLSFVVDREKEGLDLLEGCDKWLNLPHLVQNAGGVKQSLSANAQRTRRGVQEVLRRVITAQLDFAPAPGRSLRGLILQGAGMASWQRNNPEHKARVRSFADHLSERIPITFAIPMMGLSAFTALSQLSCGRLAEHLGPDITRQLLAYAATLQLHPSQLAQDSSLPVLNGKLTGVPAGQAGLLECMRPAEAKLQMALSHVLEASNLWPFLGLLAEPTLAAQHRLVGQAQDHVATVEQQVSEESNSITQIKESRNLLLASGFHRITLSDPELCRRLVDYCGNGSNFVQDVTTAFNFWKRTTVPDMLRTFKEANVLPHLRAAMANVCDQLVRVLASEDAQLAWMAPDHHWRHPKALLAVWLKDAAAGVDLAPVHAGVVDLRGLIQEKSYELLADVLVRFIRDVSDHLQPGQTKKIVRQVLEGHFRLGDLVAERFRLAFFHRAKKLHQQLRLYNRVLDDVIRKALSTESEQANLYNALVAAGSDTQRTTEAVKAWSQRFTTLLADRLCQQLLALLDTHIHGLERRLYLDQLVTIRTSTFRKGVYGPVFRNFFKGLKQSDVLDDEQEKLKAVSDAMTQLSKELKLLLQPSKVPGVIGGPGDQCMLQMSLESAGKHRDAFQQAAATPFKGPPAVIMVKMEPQVEPDSNPPPATPAPRPATHAAPNSNLASAAQTAGKRAPHVTQDAAPGPRTQRQDAAPVSGPPAKKQRGSGVPATAQRNTAAEDPHFCYTVSSALRKIVTEGMPYVPTKAFINLSTGLGRRLTRQELATALPRHGWRLLTPQQRDQLMITPQVRDELQRRMSETYAPSEKDMRQDDWYQLQAVPHQAVPAGMSAFDTARGEMIVTMEILRCGLLANGPGGVDRTRLVVAGMEGVSTFTYRVQGQAKVAKDVRKAVLKVYVPVESDGDENSD